MTDKGKARLAQKALDECARIIGGFGQFKSKADTSEFRTAAETFKGLTGVDPLQIFELIFERWTAPLSDVLA